MHAFGGPFLIAHRGGVVDEGRSENSFAALEEAIRRGYTHVEVDARVTADGHVVCFHNDTLGEEAGIDGRISEMPLDAVTKVALTRSGERVPTFGAFCERCAGRIGVMVDLKGCPDSLIDSYAAEIEAALAAQGMLRDALILINKEPVDNQDRVAQRFEGKAWVSWRAPLEETGNAVRQDPGLPDRRYVLNHGGDFTREDVAGYQAMGLRVIPSVNRSHYDEGDPMAQGIAHIERLKDWGVDGFQIDSCYDRHLIKSG